MNFAHLGIPEYLETGTWSTKAIKECSKVCDLNICASSEESNFTNVPELTTGNLDHQMAIFIM